MKKGRCKSCKFVECTIPEVTGRQFGHYFCHRFPPNARDAFPKVAGDWWCGEYQPAETEVKVT